MGYELEDVDKLINNATPDLFKTLKLNTMTIAKLNRAGVLSESIDDELKTDGLSNFKKISLFLDDLKAGPIEKFLNFCRVMKEEGQYHIVNYLGVDIDIIYAQLGVEPPKPRPPTPDSVEPEAERLNPHPENNNVPGGGGKLWEQGHPDSDMYLCNDQELFAKFIEGSPTLKRLVRTKDLWVYLQRYHVMDDLEVERCQMGTRGDQVEAIINILKQGEVWRTHAFFRSLAQIDQAGLIDQVLGKGNKEVYMENLLER